MKYKQRIIEITEHKKYYKERKSKKTKSEKAN